MSSMTSIRGLLQLHLLRGYAAFLKGATSSNAGDDSKALMKVYMPAIDGHVPIEMVRTLHAFLEFCYLVRRNVIDENSLNQIQDALRHFYQFRGIFKDTNMVNLFSLPRQHSMKHYVDTIQLFGAPNSLCSSITESKHIKTIKELYRQSN
ncbi:hypothetical protein OG21DRAFT_1492301 [Imleria badia]|nr:hypothetical protein OG21DRAFT_1492301 [Imleria badia]